MHLSSVLKAILFASFAYVKADNAIAPINIRAGVVDSLSSDIAAVSNAIVPTATQTAGTATASDATPIIMSTGGLIHETSGPPTASKITATTSVTTTSSPSTSHPTTVSGSAGTANGTASGVSTSSTAKVPSGTATANTTNTSKKSTASASPTKKSGASPLHGFDGSAGMLFLIGILAAL